MHFIDEDKAQVGNVEKRTPERGTRSEISRLPKLEARSQCKGLHNTLHREKPLCFVPRASFHLGRGNVWKRVQSAPPE